MKKHIELALEATYRAFGTEYDYAGVTVLIMQDEKIIIENEMQRAFKIRSKDVPRTIISEVEQLNENIIGGMNIVGWEYNGNSREEIIFIIEGDGRGN